MKQTQIEEVWGQWGRRTLAALCRETDELDVETLEQLVAVSRRSRLKATRSGIIADLERVLLEATAQQELFGGAS